MSMYDTNRRNRKVYGNNWYGKNGKRKIVAKMLRIAQDGLCKYCNLPLPEKDSIDHIVPLAEGGKHEIKNMQLLCLPCHVEKDRPTCTKFGTLGLVKKYGKES